LNYPETRIKIERKIYEGYYDRILDLIYAASNDISSIMIFGHNPTITQLANLFLHPGIENMPTSCVVCLSFDTLKWEEIPAKEAIQEFIIFPKMLK
jgi:phosphohistidine phosphatase